MFLSGFRFHLDSSSHYIINTSTFHIQCYTDTLLFGMTPFLTELLEVGEVRDCTVFLKLLSTLGQKSLMGVLATKQISTLNKFINTLRTGFLNCLNARSRGLTFRHRASCI